MIGRILLFMTMAAAAGGCSDTSPAAPGKESLVEVSLGSFRVPLAPRRDAPDAVERHSLLLRFELFALVPSDSEPAVRERLATHEVRLRDEVINTCRQATLGEVNEPSLTALKAHLAKAAAKHFAPGYVRRVVLSDVLLEPT